MYRGRLQLTKTSLVDEKLTEDELDKNTCMICLDIVTAPVSCTVCKSMYCLSCANMWKGKYNNCPKKCQQPWQLNVHKSSGILLRCPYDKECPHSTPETLTKHLVICKSTPEDIKRAFRLRDNYQCEKEHLLEFWVANFQEMIDSECNQCKENTNCRSVCHKCKVKYCVSCRPPPCTKSKCPNGHAYIEHEHFPHMTYICDICGLEAGPIYKNIFDDVKCNFGVCENCIKELPEVQDIQAAKNRYQECAKGHILGYLPAPVAGVCCHCDFNRDLDRCCEKCETRYCLDCKPMKIRSNNSCIKKHQFVLHEQPVEGLCRRCKQPQVMVTDEECHLGICSSCYLTMKTDNENFERIVGQYCEAPAKHNLDPFSNKALCEVCKKEVYCPLRCGPCHAFFCMNCRPSKHSKEDYVGHPFESNETEQRQCKSCGQKTTHLMECDVCELWVCRPCYDKL